jgi:hypothetical protein
MTKEEKQFVLRAAETAFSFGLVIAFMAGLWALVMMATASKYCPTNTVRRAAKTAAIGPEHIAEIYCHSMREDLDWEKHCEIAHHSFSPCPLD